MSPPSFNSKREQENIFKILRLQLFQRINSRLRLAVVKHFLFLREKSTLNDLKTVAEVNALPI